MSLTIPAIGANASVTVQDTSWCNIGDFVSVQGAGGSGQSAVLQINNITGNTLNLLNPAQTGAIPLASVTGPGLANALSGASTDYLGGDNQCHNVSGLNRYYGVDSTNATALVVTVNSDFSLSKGVVVWVLPTASGFNGASPNLNVNSTGAISIVNRAGIAPSIAELPVNVMFGVVYDGTYWRLITPIRRKYTTGTNPGTVTVECAGYDAVGVSITLTTAAANAVTLAHLGEGVPFNVYIYNGYSAAVTYSVTATQANGAAASAAYWNWSNVLTGVGNSTISASLTNGLAVFLQGFLNNSLLVCK